MSIIPYLSEEKTVIEVSTSVDEIDGRNSTEPVL